MPVSDFCYSQKDGRSSRYFESEENQCVDFDTTLRMETLNIILPNLRNEDWAVSIDLKEAYLHVPVHPLSRRLLGFKFLDKT